MERKEIKNEWKCDFKEEKEGRRMEKGKDL